MSGQIRKRVKDLQEKGCYGAMTLFCFALPCPVEKTPRREQELRGLMVGLNSAFPNEAEF